MIVSAIILVVMARGLGPEGFGVFSVVMGLVLVVNSLFEPRMQDVAAAKFWDLNAEGPSEGRHDDAVVDLFMIEAIGKILPLAGLWLLAHFLAQLAQLPDESAWLIGLAAFGTYLSKFGNGLAIGLLRIVGRSDIFAFCLIGEAALRLLALVALSITGKLTPTTAIVAQLVSGAICTVVQWALVSRFTVNMPLALKNWQAGGIAARMLPYRRFLFANLGLSVTDLMNKDLDITLLSTMMPTAQVGIYKMAKSLAMLAWRAIDPFYVALMPEVSKLVSQRDLRSVRRLIAKSVFGLFGGSALIAAASYTFLFYLSGTIFGAEFSPVAELLPFMMPGISLAAGLIWAHPLAVALGRPDYALIGSLVSAVAGIAAFLLIVPLLGTTGAGLAWTLTFVANFALIAILTLMKLRRVS